MNADFNIIPTELQPFLQLKCLNLPPNHKNIFSALKIATEAIAHKIRVEKKYCIILGQSPFSIPVGDASTTLTCTLDNEIVGLTSGNMIFLDCQKLQCRPHQQTVAIILEEFVHLLMNVADDSLVKQIVPLLYPEVYWDALRGFWPNQDHKADV